MKKNVVFLMAVFVGMSFFHTNSLSEEVKSEKKLRSIEEINDALLQSAVICKSQVDYLDFAVLLMEIHSILQPEAKKAADAAVRGYRELQKIYQGNLDLIYERKTQIMNAPTLKDSNILFEDLIEKLIESMNRFQEENEKLHKQLKMTFRPKTNT